MKKAVRRKAVTEDSAPDSTDLARFHKLGIRTREDLLFHLPLRYEDETRLTPVADLRPGDLAQVEGVVTHSEVSLRGRRSLVVELRDDRGDGLTLRFFTFYGSQQRQLAAGRRLRAIGEARGGLFGLEFVHPRYRLVSPGDPLPERLTPVYPSAAGIPQSALRAAIGQALDHAALDETLPEEVMRQLGLPGLLEALRNLHRPQAGTDLQAFADRSSPAWRRVIFDELLSQQLSLRLARARRARQKAPKLSGTDGVRDLLADLPFRLTAAQQRAWSEVQTDLAGEQPMNRLLQGDVGSGKTVIAALAAAQAIGSGWQCALMAPTELLAEQHHRKLAPWMEAIGARVQWLSGSLGAAAKRSVRAAVQDHSVDLLIGTHALVEDSVGFARLGLVIVDEQHRFGVEQRLALRDKRDGTQEGAAASSHVLPHQLLMSATPIPRTLAMTFYADLDVSTIDELPPGRQPVRTRLVSEERRDEMIERVRIEVGRGRQVYWVCPLIEESEALDLQNAIDTHASVADALAPLEVGLVHGRLPGADRQRVMEGFIAGRIPVLVATTVIEVGVDVPNATMMVIEHAERFGLAQLHQLRGRIGRGQGQSTCVLMYRQPLSQTARERLRIVYESSDGFEIAQRDLQLRGPGEMLGARQSGTALLRFADLERDDALAVLARDVAGRMIDGPAELVERQLGRWASGRQDWLRA